MGTSAGNTGVSAPPFVANSADGFHCLEACAAMIVRAFESDQRACEPADVAAMTGHLNGRYSWRVILADSMGDVGYETRLIDAFDYRRFVADPEAYLMEFYGDEVGRDQIENSSLDVVVGRVGKFLRNSRVDWQQRVPTIDDIAQLARDGFLTVCNVNQRMIQGGAGYVGHFVLVFCVCESSLILHNPGPPACQACRVPFATFLPAWSYPTEMARNALAVRR